MGSENELMAFVGIFIYILGALFIVLWLYLTTKVTFSIFNKDRVILRVISWPVIAWFLALAMYLFFVLAAGFLGIAIQSFLEILKLS